MAAGGYVAKTTQFKMLSLGVFFGIDPYYFPIAVNSVSYSV